MTSVTIRIPEELVAELQKLCQQQHRSISDAVRESLRRYLAAEQLHQIRQMIRSRAESRGFLTDEDVFKVVS
jgi:predicted transcriptional regulator